MKAIPAVYSDGQIKLENVAPPVAADDGPVKVLVIFPDAAENQWERILNDPRPRPKLQKLVKQVRKNIALGKAAPLDEDRL